MTRFSIVVPPGGAQSELVGRHGNVRKVQVAAVAERGRANAELDWVLAALLSVARDDVRIVADRSARRKVVDVVAVGGEDVERRLEAAAARR
ncbi:MAG: DUF167 domain-containing protein [Actinomycetota bacterium]|nr:DUF167 domain-containing protein [Actinomycetota bacterium]